MEDQIIVYGNPNEIAGFLLSLSILNSSKFITYVNDGLTNSEIITEKTPLVTAKISWLKEDRNFPGVFNELKILKINIQKIPNNNSLIKFQPKYKDDNETPCNEIQEEIIRELKSQGWLEKQSTPLNNDDSKSFSNGQIDLKPEQRGKKPFLDYEKAYEYLLAGHDFEETHINWCKEMDYALNDKALRKLLWRAMKYRKKTREPK